MIKLNLFSLPSLREGLGMGAKKWTQFSHEKAFVITFIKRYVITKAILTDVISVYDNLHKKPYFFYMPFLGNVWYPSTEHTISMIRYFFAQRTNGNTTTKTKWE